jgi:hypothetical protein
MKDNQKLLNDAASLFGAERLRTLRKVTCGDDRAAISLLLNEVWERNGEEDLGVACLPELRHLKDWYEAASEWEQKK